ncbi:MAG: phosphate acyltransferase [Leptospirales bacterium]
MSLLENLKTVIRTKPPSLVFSEGDDERIVAAAVDLIREGLAKEITLIGNPEIINSLAAKQGIKLNNIRFIDPNHNDLQEKFAERLVTLQPKYYDMESAREAVKNRLVFGTLFHETGMANVHITGAVETSADVIRTFYQVLKTNRKEGLATSFFMMYREKSETQPEMVSFFADCAVNISPSPKYLARIAYQVGNIAKDVYNIEPRAALLTYSTKGSGSGEPVDAIIQAGQELEKLNPSFVYDVELQADTALSADVAQRKAPKSPIQGNANVFIFPDLSSGNIGYKLAQQFGGLSALGPVMVGLGKHASDLSRGCNKEEIIGTYVITAYYHLVKSGQIEA